MGPGPANVRFGSLADICSAIGHVHFTPESDIPRDHMPDKKLFLVDWSDNDNWEHLNARGVLRHYRGVGTFALDGFTGRGLASVNTDQALLGRLNFILDAYRALDILARHPRVDPSRIALMGFSRGGQAALFASLNRFHQIWNKSGTDFAAYIPFYPDCMTTYISDTDIADKPIRIFHGTPDDYNPVAPCKVFVERLRAAGRDVVLTEYPNVWHAFDNPLGSPVPVVVKGAQSVRNCQIAEEPKGVLINRVSKQQFTYKDACVEHDPHVNHDAEATRAATSAVEGLLKAAFKLE